MTIDCIIIGGGIAGIQASIQLARYHREVLVIDAGEGRSSLCRQYNNILGFPEGVSGEELRKKGFQHAEKFGVNRITQTVMRVHKSRDVFVVETDHGQIYKSLTLLVATGVKDHLPDIPGIKPCLGLSLYICPDCDGYEITNKKTFVLGSGDAGAHMAITLLYWSEDLTFINHGRGEISLEMQGQLQENHISVQQIDVQEVLHNDGVFQGIKTDSGQVLQAEKGFLAFGGNHVRSELADSLGAETNDKNHLLTDSRSKMTNIDGLWAAGDAAVHSELVTAAMGEGAQAAIWIHKWLMRKVQK
ncbi:NAD(P)/FAD-dependent oxidoreductase [Halobacillus litoralis]|uniref:Pyridine nucleotide-disulfide oxidoreductase n=1 Tax=Halobacillus litoralis TaxID=45668 RepID=A0A410MI14_9BACI|nr:NAD(P)/FAD-dependent oxidoreductase [Halobacillus litoralis]QAS54338.1 pyridine nucleotide-disulfide oxidoreductase [Halobacillus litoralis]